MVQGFRTEVVDMALEDGAADGLCADGYQRADAQERVGVGVCAHREDLEQVVSEPAAVGGERVG